ncbi:M48 family metalloprotease [Roseobacter sp. HKCCA0434]|uniref:M48 family metalloprotease n=1 Tax=Roseobacter sp. HKCCA0434 TaxID=3079297 RepID=UPI002905C83D|nr:M48 family metalloprotease [Roseobacter sp. HKCCA0434]
MLLRRLIALLSLVALLGCAGDGAITGRERAGTHLALVASQGGLLQDAALQAYVEGVTARVIEATPQRGSDWNVFVLDSPMINAFAQDGPLIYLTRGLIALANDEAELAAVIAHEIAHVEADHNTALRRQRDAARRDLKREFGRVAQSGGRLDSDRRAQLADRARRSVAAFSREQEAEADVIGLTYLEAAGYDARAMADFLDAMIADGALAARVAGRAFDPEARADRLATHPSGATRRRIVLSRIRDGGGERGAARHLAALDGMIWGEDGTDGFLLADAWVDPARGIAVPDFGAELFMQGDTVFVEPRGEALTGFQAVGAVPGGPRAYLERDWADLIDRTRGAARLEWNDRPGYSSLTIRLPLGNKPDSPELFVQVQARQVGREIVEFLTLAEAGDSAAITLMQRMAQATRAPTTAERRAAVPLRIALRPVRAGDRQQDIAAEMQVPDLALERLQALNNLDAGDALEPGDMLKILVR